ncbi:MAG: hypothetical protein JEY94_16370 [Melioribacteraceae bacterium]|nr:hypothetical protein [Melioribacteraceae bacterium]
MINSVMHNVFFSSENVRVKSQGKIELRPQTNSIVLLNILDKSLKNFRLLINGSVFQAELPIKAETGDVVLAKVLSQKPLVLELANLLNPKLLTNTVYNDILSKLSINASATAKEVVKELISEKKPLVKGKMERIINYIDSNKLNHDDLQINFLINFFWHSSDNSEEMLERLNDIFDITFTRLASKIYEYTILANRLYPTNSFTQKLNNVFVFDYKKFEIDKDDLPVKNKSEAIPELFALLELTDSLLPHEKKELKQLLLKYILQKSIYQYYNFHPEFTILKLPKEFHLTLFKTEIKHSYGGEVIIALLLNLMTPKYGSIIFKGNYSMFRLNGEILSDINSIGQIDKIIKKMNEEISEELDIDSKIFTSLLKENIAVEDIGKTGNINFMA